MGKKTKLMLTLWAMRPLFIPALIMLVELAIWAGLNLAGLADKDWYLWRIGLLIALFIMLYTAAACGGKTRENILFASVGIVLPWVLMLAYILCFGFIYMSMNFVTLDWFFSGVLVSGACQFICVTFFKVMRTY